MKKFWIITLCLLVAILAVVAAWHFLPSGGPEVSSLYRQYERQPGVRVGYIEDYRFNDSTQADVVTVEALDSVGWQWMGAEFHLPPLAPRHDSLLATGSDVVQTWLLPDGGTFAFLSRRNRALCLVQTGNDQALFDKILMYHLQKLKEE